MPKVIQKPKYGRDKYRCPRCGAVHWHDFKKCLKKNCNYVGPLRRE